MSDRQTEIITLETVEYESVDEWPAYGPWRMSVLASPDMSEDNVAIVKSNLVERLFRHLVQAGNSTHDFTIRISDKLAEFADEDKGVLVGPRTRRKISVYLMHPIYAVSSDGESKLTLKRYVADAPLSVEHAR